MLGQLGYSLHVKDYILNTNTRGATVKSNCQNFFDCASSNLKKIFVKKYFNYGKNDFCANLV